LQTTYLHESLEGLNSSLAQSDGELSPKNNPGPGKDGQNNAKTPLLVTFPPEKLKPKTKKFFFDLVYKTCWIRRGFEQGSSSIAWRGIGLQTLQEKWRTRDWKG